MSERRTPPSVFQERKKRLSSFSVLLLLALSLFSGLILLQPEYAHAAVAIVQGPYAQTCGIAATCAQVYTNAVTAGNIAAVAFFIHNTATPTVTDTDGATFTIVCGTGSIWQSCVTYTTIKNNHGVGAYTVTVHNGGANTEMDTSMFEVSGGSVVCTGSGTGTSGTTATTAAPCSFSTSWFLLGSASNNNGAAMSLGTGYTTCHAPWVVGLMCEYDTTSVTSPTSFPSTWAGSSAWQDSGLVIGNLGPTGNCVHVKACSAGITVASNSAIVVGVQCANNCQGVAPFGTSTVTDTLGNTFTLQTSISTCNVIGPCAGNTSVASGLYTSSGLVTGTDTITFNYPLGESSISLELYDVTGVSATPSCTNTGYSPAATTIQTSGALCVIPAGGIAFSSLSALTATLTAGSSYTLTTSGVVFQGTQEATTGLVTTNFPATLSVGDHVSDAGMVLSATNAPTGSAVVGSCPTKNTGTITLANNTEYLYTGASIPGETISSISSFVASVTSVAATEKVYFGIYTSTGTTISAINPLTLQTFFTFTLTAGTTNSPLNWNTGYFLSIPAGSTFAIALLGNSKIKINQSAFSGLNTAATAGGTLATSLTSISSTTTEMYLCAQLNFQVIATTTITSTSTITTTTGGIATATISTTTTLTSLSANAAVGNSVGIAFVLLILLAPAFAIAIALAAYTKSPIGAGLGFVSGLAIGALLGNQGGLIPFSVLAGLMVVVVLLIIGFLYALGRNGG